MEIERAIANLLDNARKFAAAGSAIQVSMEQTDALTRVIVASRGVAIAPSEREHIFEPFVRGNVRQPGSGLGLALVRDAAQRHGGTAYVEVDGEVSRFVFELRD